MATQSLPSPQVQPIPIPKRQVSQERLLVPSSTNRAGAFVWMVWGDCAGPFSGKELNMATRSSKKVKRGNQPTLAQRVERVEASQEHLGNEVHKFLDGIEAIQRDMRVLLGKIIRQVKAKRLAGKGVRRG